MNEKPPVLQTNVSCKDRDYSEVSCDPKLRRRDSSIFADWSCGEPLPKQHLVIDFTPSNEIDTDFVQRKCCAFWDLITKSPELRHLMVSPDLIQCPSKKPEVSSTPPEGYSSSSASSESISCERTARSILEFAGEKGVVKDAFVPRVSTTCSLGPREYTENEPTATTYSVSRQGRKYDGSCKLNKGRQPKQGIPTSTPEVKHLCKTMRDWDSDQPKSMKPSVRVSYLSHCVMQRNVNS